MTQYAVVKNDEVVNVIEAESIEVAKELADDSAFEISITSEGLPAVGIGYKLVEGEWVKPQPHIS